MDIAFREAEDLYLNIGIKDLKRTIFPMTVCSV